MFTLVITSPHSLCPEGILERHCDLLAYLAATRLLMSLDPVIEADYYPATRFRDDIDLNRPVSRGMRYRKELTQGLERARLVIDIHSYQRGEFRGSDIAVLDNILGTWYGRLLFELLQRAGVNVAYFYGSEVNDITMEARNRGIPAILLEYQEGLKIDQIDQINEIIRIWIDYMLLVPKPSYPEYGAAVGGI